MKKNKNSKQAEEWFKIGDNELGFARWALDESDEFYAQICVQAHQAIEKYLKGFLVFNDVEYPKTHDLGELIKLCSKINEDFKDFLSECNEISGYYIDLRYPVHFEQKTKKQAKEAVEAAEGIKKFVRGLIK